MRVRVVTVVRLRRDDDAVVRCYGGRLLMVAVLVTMVRCYGGVVARCMVGALTPVVRRCGSAVDVR